jgi:hypothetical protein
MIGPSLFVLLVTLVCPCALAARADYAANATSATIGTSLNVDQRRFQSPRANRFF